MSNGEMLALSVAILLGVAGGVSIFRSHKISNYLFKVNASILHIPTDERYANEVNASTRRRENLTDQVSTKKKTWGVARYCLASSVSEIWGIRFLGLVAILISIMIILALLYIIHEVE